MLIAGGAPQRLHHQARSILAEIEEEPDLFAEAIVEVGVAVLDLLAQTRLCSTGITAKGTDAKR